MEQDSCPDVSFAAEVIALREEVRKLKEQIESLTMKRFRIHRFAASDKDIQFFTRFSSYTLLMQFWAQIEPVVPFLVSVRQAQRGALTESRSASHSLQPIDEFFMFLNYLAIGSKQQDLAERFSVHQSTDYPDTTVILDCTKLRCQCPSSPLLQSEVFSHCTVKGLIGIAPHGAVTFVSALYAGLISDKQITKESGIINRLKPGMAVMVVRGFLIDDIVPCKIYRPAFLAGRSQMSDIEVRETQAIAHLRVHVERLIRRVKEHKFFDSEIPLRLFGSINQLYTVACLLTNYENGPLVKAWVKKPE
ncbi:hypothetical protein N1851_000060 [Merluccius polli]|uniref:DDE Tnp4 domain-containing protein n=1 Tax=Merluccius polli TaxID=89951 RepID=A0AA47NCN7_MERPO|nr:hypothetical protein N1851_000060 [Merluccius polli]